MTIKLSTVNGIAVGIVLVMALVLGGSIVFLTQAIQAEQEAVAKQAEFKQLGIDLANASDYLTNEVRKYVVNTDRAHLQNYWDEIEKTKTRDKVLRRLGELNAPQAEFDQLALAKQNSDALVNTETRGMRLVLEAEGTSPQAMHPAIRAYELSPSDAVLPAEDKLIKAREIMFDRQYTQDKKIIMDPIAKFQQLMNSRAELEVAQTQQITRYAEIVLIVVAVLMPLSMGVVLWIFSTHLSKPIVSYIRAFEDRDEQDVDFTLTPIGAVELQLLAQTFNLMTAELQTRIAEAVAKETIEQTVNEYNQFIERVADGDLTRRLSINGNGNNARGHEDLVTLGRNLNVMVERLGEMAFQLREATNNISSASAEILASATQQSAGANEQSAAISQTSSTIDEVNAIVSQLYSKAKEVADKTQQTNTISDSGQEAVQKTVDGMVQIKEKVSGIAENILALSEQTQQIGEITATVNDIASQSNLLALNASVEAARAGEHGKGFAVVAVEVRNLAEQSKQATAQVKAILSEIQQATNAAVMATEEGTKGVDSGVVLTEQTGKTILQLAGSIKESTGLAEQIVASTQQQNLGIEQITVAMQHINQATVQSLSSTQQTERSAQDLSLLAKQLEDLVARYKLNMN
ncbi:methyl-accepting chemotaxis protein [Anaerolineales bacterium HSG6]|nr:methyl-accepting chemotaxis protein [Anaerolineales bacterium HSG6]MDM8529831.1 methyl-accepting chemotaxis protein [Anaerolineales bacterium HSG25]